MAPPLSEADALRVEAIHAEREAIYRKDRGNGIEAADGFRLDRLMKELQDIRDRQWGTKPKPVSIGPVPKLQRKPRKKAKQPRNLCHCDLERFKDELSPGQFAADGSLAPCILAVKPPRMPRATSVRTLCPGCHLPHLFRHAERWGKSPAEYVTVFHGFPVNAEDAAWLDERFAEWKGEVK